MDEKKDYCVFVKSSKFEEKMLEIIKDEINMTSNNESDYYKVYLSRGDVYIYRINKNTIGICLVLVDSYVEMSTVLIAPIYKIISENDLKEGFRIGFLPEYDLNHEYIVKLDETRYINKKRLFNDVYYHVEKISYISNFLMMALLIEYKNLFNRMINDCVEFKKLYLC